MAFRFPETLTRSGLTDLLTAVAYVSGNIQVFRNGVCLDPDLDDGWTEIDSTTVRLKESAPASDVFVAYYEEA